MVKPLMEAVAPRSTWSHCGSLQAEDQRVVRSPSMALDGGYAALCTEEAVASAPMERFVSVAACAATDDPTVSSPASRARIATVAVMRLRGRRRSPRRAETPLSRNPAPPLDLLPFPGFPIVPVSKGDLVLDIQPPRSALASSQTFPERFRGRVCCRAQHQSRTSGGSTAGSGVR